MEAGRVLGIYWNIVVGQVHKQNNKVIKMEGGAIGIFDNPKALMKWAVT